MPPEDRKNNPSESLEPKGEANEPLVDYYDALNVDKNAQKEDIDSSYNYQYEVIEKMQESGVIDDQETAKRMQTLSDIKDTLLDEGKRKDYDELLKETKLDIGNEAIDKIFSKAPNQPSETSSKEDIFGDSIPNQGAPQVPENVQDSQAPQGEELVANNLANKEDIHLPIEPEEDFHLPETPTLEIGGTDSLSLEKFLGEEFPEEFYDDLDRLDLDPEFIELTAEGAFDVQEKADSIIKQGNDELEKGLESLDASEDEKEEAKKVMLPIQEEIGNILPEATREIEETLDLTETSEQKEDSDLVVYGESRASEKHPERNEDAMLADQENDLFGMFDGLGGKKGGKVASGIAKRYVAGHAPELKGLSVEETKEALKKIIEGADGKIFDAQYDSVSLDGMATTLTLVKLWEGEGGSKIIIANVGGRVYRQKTDKKLEELTFDDKLDDATIKLQRELNNADNPQEFADQNDLDYFPQITKSIGGDQISLDEEDSKISMHVIDVNEGEKIIIPTDGVFNNLATYEMEEVLKKEGDPSENLVNAASKRSKENHPRAKKDDMTALVIELPKKTKITKKEEYSETTEENTVREKLDKAYGDTTPETVGESKQKEQQGELKMPKERNLWETLNKIEDEKAQQKEFNRIVKHFQEGERVYGTKNGKMEYYMQLVDVTTNEGEIHADSELKFKIFDLQGQEIKGKTITKKISDIKYREWKKIKDDSEMPKDGNTHVDENGALSRINEKDLEFWTRAKNNTRRYEDKEKNIAYKIAIQSRSSADFRLTPAQEKLVAQNKEQKPVKQENSSSQEQLKKEYFELLASSLFFCDERIKEFKEKNNKTAQDYFAHVAYDIRLIQARNREKINYLTSEKLQKYIENHKEKIEILNRVAEKFRGGETYKSNGQEKQVNNKEKVPLEGKEALKKEYFQLMENSIGFCRSKVEDFRVKNSNAYHYFINASKAFNLELSVAKTNDITIEDIKERIANHQEKMKTVRAKVYEYESEINTGKTQSKPEALKAAQMELEKLEKELEFLKPNSKGVMNTFKSGAGGVIKFLTRGRKTNQQWENASRIDELEEKIDELEETIEVLEKNQTNR